MSITKQNLNQYLSDTKRLEDLLPSSIYWLPYKDVEIFFNYSDTTRRRDVALLQSLNLLPQNPGKRGFNRSELRILWEFRQLQAQMDRNEAIANIKPLMEYINEQQRQKAS